MLSAGQQATRMRCGLADSRTLGMQSGAEETRLSFDFVARPQPQPGAAVPR